MKVNPGSVVMKIMKKDKEVCSNPHPNPYPDPTSDRNPDPDPQLRIGGRVLAAPLGRQEAGEEHGHH